MPGFSHLSKLDVDAGKLVEWTVPVLGSTVLVAYAGPRNQPFYAAFLKSQRPSVRELVGGRLTPKTLDRNRDTDRDLYRRFIVKGFGSRPPTDEDGNVSADTVENARAFLDALPDWMFENLRGFCQNELNFVDAEEPTEDEAAVLEGNA